MGYTKLHVSVSVYVHVYVCVCFVLYRCVPNRPPFAGILLSAAAIASAGGYANDVDVAVDVTDDASRQWSTA